MREVAATLNAMREAGVIRDYALFGAAAQMRYTEAVATFHADVLVALPPPDRLDVLGPIYAFCAARGLPPEGEAIRIGAWPWSCGKRLGICAAGAQLRPRQTSFPPNPRIERIDRFTAIRKSGLSRSKMPKRMFRGATVLQPPLGRGINGRSHDSTRSDPDHGPLAPRALGLPR